MRHKVIVDFHAREAGRMPVAKIVPEKFNHNSLAISLEWSVKTAAQTLTTNASPFKILKSLATAPDRECSIPSLNAASGMQLHSLAKALRELEEAGLLGISVATELPTLCFVGPCISFPLDDGTCDS